jgi:hypothetical protein
MNQGNIPLVISDSFLMKNPTEQFGVGFAVGMVAGMAKSGMEGSGAWGDSKADDQILEFSLDAAGEIGVDAAEMIWSTATDVSDQF